MNAFAEWPLQRQKQFWMRLAQDVISRWNLTAAQLFWLGYGSNAVFKVDSADGEFVLRLHPPGRVNADELRSELTWLRHIRANTDLPAPVPIATVDDVGDTSFAIIKSEHLPAPHCVHACLFEYISGEPKSASLLTAEDMRRIGNFLGQLHSIGQFTPPTRFTRPRLDWSGLFGLDSPCHASDSSGLLTDDQAAIFSQVARRVRAAMDTLGANADTFGLIHADLLAKNILFHKDQPAALDFEFSGWGYFLYDLAPLLWQLKGDRATDYRHLESALWSGYTALSHQDKENRRLLEDFIAARQLASLRWLLANLHHPTIRQIAPSLIAARTDELQSYLLDGVLRRQTPTL